MAESGRMIAIAIGVADSVPAKYLAGAVNGAHAFQTWAAAQGYETLLVTDEAGPVTISLLRDKIKARLEQADNPAASGDPLHRIIVYFAGHGLIRELEEGLWLLSDWEKDLRGVAVEVLKRRLSMYGPRQITIISDACRSLPADVEQADLVADAVLGAGPRPADMSIAIDKFIAAQDGAAAFMIPGANPEDDRCLFTGVLIEGLWGQKGLTGEPFSKIFPDKITSRSLGAYLQAEASARAKSYNLTLIPSISPTFPEEDDLYFSKGDGGVAPAFPPWPPKGDLPGAAASALLGQWSAESGTAPSGATEFLQGQAGHSAAALSILGAAPPPPSTADRLRAQPLPAPASAIVTGFGVSGGAVRRIWSGRDVEVKQPSPANWWSVTRSGGSGAPLAASTLIEFTDGLIASAVALPGLFASIVRDDFGVTGMVYRDLYSPSPQADAAAAEDAMAALDSGALRADGATEWAVRLCRNKHADPVLGVISAYLYDAIGDIEAIRRMAGFYAQEGEPIPFDIAFLAGLTGRMTDQGFHVDIPPVAAREPNTDAEVGAPWTHCAMPPLSSFVAGLWPWMRQGWVFLDDPSDVTSPLILPDLVDIRAGLMRSRFATFEADAGARLAAIAGLQPSLRS